uniref:Uncharacterized protein TCIL3000_9_5660 n=1 Tax=Trypanosoma congolense (strain IL3000) TaxID=1068625 RepID=G0UUU4_TRYCI|nr:unnamed protein product [Trypanosoma congolense IL3000]
MKHMLLSVIKSFKDLCSSYNTVNDANESTPPLSEVDRAHGSTDPTATNGGDPGPSRSPPLALPTNVWMDNATQKPDNPPPPVVTLSVLEETVAAQREEYEHTLRGLNERNGVLESEVRTLEEQAKQDAMRYEEEMTRLEERHRLEVSALNENLKLLEGALEAKEEEHQTLAQSLNMLEEQLRAALTRCADESKEKALLRQELQSMTKERDHLFVLVAQIFEEWRGVTVNERPHPTDETIKDFEQQSAVTPLLAACSGANYKEGGNGEDLCDFAQPTQLRFSPTPLSHLVQDTFSNQEGPSHSVQYSSAAPTFEQIQDPLIDASANAFDGQVSPGPASNTVQDLYAALDGAPKHNIPQRSTFDEINLPDNTAKDVVPAQPSDCVLHTSRRAKPLTFNPFAGMGDGDDVLDL